MTKKPTPKPKGSLSLGSVVRYIGTQRHYIVAVSDGKKAACHLLRSEPKERPMKYVNAAEILPVDKLEVV